MGQQEVRPRQAQHELLPRNDHHPPAASTQQQVLPTLDPAESPLLFTRAISFARFRTAGMKRTLRQGSNERFVTPQRLLTLLQGTRYPRKKLAKPVTAAAKKAAGGGGGGETSSEESEDSLDSSVSEDDEDDGEDAHMRRRGRSTAGKRQKDAGQVSLP